MNEPGRCYCHDPPTVHFKRLHRKRKEAPSAPEGGHDPKTCIASPCRTCFDLECAEQASMNEAGVKRDD